MLTNEDQRRLAKLEVLYIEVGKLFQYLDKKLNWSILRPKQKTNRRRGPYARIRDAYLDVNSDVFPEKK